MLRLAVVAVAAMLLSGCFSKDASRSDMEAQAAAALDAFRSDVLPGGRLASISIGGMIEVDTGGAFRPRLSPDVDVQLGPGGEVLIDGTLAGMRLTGYCDATHIVTVTQNTRNYGIPEGRVESRNPLGVCSGPGSEQLLTMAFEFELIDPAILTGQLNVDELEAVAFTDIGKNKVEAQYLSRGPGGDTTLFVKVHGDRVVQVVSENAASRLVMDMGYGDRSPVTKPQADKRIASPVTGTESVDDNGWHWRGHTREGGPIGEYSLIVYPKDASLACGGADKAPIVAFDLDGPALQESAGWRLVVTEDGNGTLGSGDELLLSPPSSMQGFTGRPILHDDWAGVWAAPSCATPGAGVGVGAWVLLAAAFMRRR